MCINWSNINLNNIKDIGSIIFSGTATVLGILTYNRAKETIFQPIRSEVAKKQSKILTDLFKFIYVNNKNGVDMLVDYEELVAVNILMWLKRYGFILKNQDEVDKNLNQKISGFVIPKDISKLDDIELIETFSQDKKPEIDIGKKRYEDGKNGKIMIDRIFITKKYSEFINKINVYLENPFLPTNIRKLLEKFIENIHINLNTHLRKIVKKFIKDIFSEKLDIKTFSINGIYNGFNHIRISHKPNFEELNIEIRKHFKVDDMPK